MEITSSMMGEILSCLAGIWQQRLEGIGNDGEQSKEHAEFTIRVLEVLTGAGRFALNVHLLTAASKVALKTLLDHLNQWGSSQSDAAEIFERLQILREAYRVNRGGP